MDKKSSNRVSIIIAVVTGVLILGGVYLLNASFNKKSNDNKQANSSSSVARVSSSSKSGSSSSTSGTATSSSQNNSNSNSSGSSKSSGSSNSESSDSSGSKSSGSSTNSDIKEGQIIAKIITRTGSSYQLEILDSKVKDSKYFTSGSKINKLTINGIDMKEGKTYKIQLSVEDNDAGFSISNFQVLGEV